MAAVADDLSENMENYRAQLKQVEAALLIDEDNDDLKKLKEDLEEVISLTRDLMQVNETPSENIASELEGLDNVVKSRTWKQGDRVRVLKKSDNEYHAATIDMIADDGISCTVKFDNSGTVDVMKVADLNPIETEISNTQIAKSSTGNLTASNKSGKLTKDDLERRREAKKKKLLKKKQRMKDFEEAREAGKQKWQTFFQKGNLKGKHKIKGINKKSIFASREDGKGKIGIGTCGTSGKGMTSFLSASQYMYKK